MNAEQLLIPVALLIPLLSWAVSWGQQRATARLLAEKLERLDRSVENFGARLGQLEQQVAAMRAVDDFSRPHRIGG